MADDNDENGLLGDDGGVGARGIDGAEADDLRPYDVGYGRPPKSGQIKPGEVRNPRGKKPGTRSLKTDVRLMLVMPVSMTKNGKVVRVTTREAALGKLREKALKGDARSLDRMLDLAAHYEEPDGDGRSTSALMADDEAILVHARERDRAANAAAQPAALPASAIDTEGKDS